MSIDVVSDCVLDAVVDIVKNVSTTVILLINEMRQVITVHVGCSEGITAIQLITVCIHIYHMQHAEGMHDLMAYA